MAFSQPSQQQPDLHHQMHKLPLNLITNPHSHILHDRQHLCRSNRLGQLKCLDSPTSADNSKHNLPDNSEQNLLNSFNRHVDGFHNNIPRDHPRFLPLPQLPLLLFQRPRQGCQMLLPLWINLLPHCRPLPHHPIHGLVYGWHLLYDHCYRSGNGHQLQFWYLLLHRR